MIYLLIILCVAIGYYTCTYGVFILKNEKNMLAAIGTILLAVISTVVSIIVLFLKY
ncbi:MAG TPA: hypothetical protein VIO64_13215 [Pseudobacteroides sp.]|uniref:hypothetical protein n=1 Tax=Pseudobacteroides sp. TaxID=1968840 RepID=UPI002F95457C